ncbi:MAG: DUF2384 domain-containing protein [Candidatus Eremiobacteraeota bacterium]|nr:DUF2384 domain-containing protein [Candidatus Eremiobacteraeota bacterium]
MIPSVMEERAGRHPVSDIDAHGQAMRLPIGRVVAELIEILGATTVAALGNVQETRAVQQWTNGRLPQRPHVLRFALQLAMMISSTHDREVARAWFQGSNPDLGDRVPVSMLQNEDLADVQRALIAGARAFALHEPWDEPEVNPPRKAG